MALAIYDDFESYSAGDLNGGAGGSGFSGNWSGDANFDVVTTPVNAGSKACGDTTGTSVAATRTFTAEAAGLAYISVQKSSNSASGNSGGIYMGDMGAGTNLIVTFRSDGFIKYFNGSVYVSYQAYSANTWYRIGIEWDNAGHPNQWRMNVDNAAFTSWVSGNGTWASIGTMTLQGANSAGTYVYYDSINTVYSPAETGGGTIVTPPNHGLLTLGIG